MGILRASAGKCILWLKAYRTVRNGKICRIPFMLAKPAEKDKRRMQMRLFSSILFQLEDDVFLLLFCLFGVVCGGGSSVNRLGFIRACAGVDVSGLDIDIGILTQLGEIFA